VSYYFVLNAYAHAALHTSVVVPVQELAEAMAVHAAAKRVSVPKRSAEALLTQSTTGVCCSESLLRDLAVAQEAADEAKAAKASKKVKSAQKKLGASLKQAEARRDIIGYVRDGGDLKRMKLPDLAVAYRGFADGGKASKKDDVVRELGILINDELGNV
jgi:hypothetical protein